ncbi:hypothetical protein, partial [Anaerotruncus massiliensis (ex Liu et al. 2021)]|uniref:hypothetical protein n=1 Tax=Anaerotruncus massiliensis (ex Liu et al. 2021) TaxID=2321404 RepID=UPI003AB1A188
RSKFVKYLTSLYDFILPPGREKIKRKLLKKYHLFVKKLCRPGAVEKDALCMYNERRKRAKKGDAR